MKIVYIAGPYNAPTFMQIEHNIRDAEATAIILWNAGFGVFCPHLNTAHFEVKANASEEQYREFDNRMLYFCDMLYALPTWSSSNGARDEVIIAQEMPIPVYFDIYMLIGQQSNVSAGKA